MNQQSDDLKRLAEARGDGMSSTEEQELDEQIKKLASQYAESNCWHDGHGSYEEIYETELNRTRALLSQHTQRARATGETSDGYHTFNELYRYRMLYNALLFNEWAAQGKYDTHKSYYHSDGEPCFGGGWFIVVADTPFGQVTNHYENKDWSKFNIPHRKTANKWDGSTPQEVSERLAQLSAKDSTNKEES